MSEQKLHLGGDKYLVAESYQVGGGGKKTQMEIYKFVHGEKEKFLTKDKYHELLQKYKSLKVEKTKADNAKKYMKRNLESNMMDLVPPYEVNPAQRRLLEHILGVKNVSDIEMFNTLVHAGIVNTRCPPLGQPEKTEAYIDPVSGRKQCRVPTPLRSVAKGQDINAVKCPNVKSGDPFATEKYIDWQGNVTCRRPVISGAFFCPQPGQPTKTESVVLPDGTGICLEPEAAHRAARTFPTQVIYPVGTDKLSLYESVFNSINMNPELVARTNNLLLTAKNVADLRARVEKDSALGWLMGAVKHMQSDNDIKATNAALYKYIQTHMPDYLHTIVGEKGAAVDAYLKFFGISSPRQLVLGGKSTEGGARKKAKATAKKAKSKATSKATPKAAAGKKKKSEKATKSKSSSSAKSSF